MSLSSQSPLDFVWTSPKSVQIPTTDILTFAFANLGRYDNDSPIFVDAKCSSNKISARQALRIVRQLIRGLKILGFKEGDCVCLHAYNNIWYPLIWLGVVGAHGRITGSNPRYTVLELTHMLTLTDPKFVFAQAECLEPMLEAAARCKIPTSNIFCIDSDHGPPPSHGLSSWRTLLNEAGSDWPSACRVDQVNQQQIVAYGMTSGTTGPPKAALISHRYIVAQTTLLEDHFAARPYRPSLLVCLPVFHAFASPLALILPLRLGLPTFFLPRWSPSEFSQTIQKFSITDAPVSPPIVGALTQLPDSEHHLLASLRYVISAGAVLPASVQNKLSEVLSPKAVVAQCWGTTEAGWHSLSSWQAQDVSGSVGTLLPGVRLKLADESGGRICEENELGEAFVHTPMMFSGYLGNVEANKDSFDSEGFYRTGDRVCVRNGKVYYNERAKDTMKVKGWQVSPSELESVLLEHPQILDVAVAGVISENELGLPETFPTAYVVRKPAEASPVDDEIPGTQAPRLNEQVVKDFVASKLISYKRITGRVIFVLNIPRTPSGKIIRRDLPQAELDLST